MSRKPSRTRTPATPVERPADPDRSVLVPQLRIEHLAEAAKRHGTEEREIRVELADPPQIKTPNRVPGQWLRSGEFLSDPRLRGERDDRNEWEGFYR
ncbi:hypothetical protein [Nocardia africana]